MKVRMLASLIYPAADILFDWFGRILHCVGRVKRAHSAIGTVAAHMSDALKRGLFEDDCTSLCAFGLKRLKFGPVIRLSNR